jgi:hypothetical protein
VFLGRIWCQLESQYRNLCARMGSRARLTPHWILWVHTRLSRMRRISVCTIRWNHMALGADNFVVRRGGKLLCVGTLDDENTVDMKIGIQKRLSIIFTYGGQWRDLRKSSI